MFGSCTRINEQALGFDFRIPKTVDEQAGAWKTNDGRCMVFFFTDHTVLQLYFGESTIGAWRYTKSKKAEIKTLEFQEAPDDGIFKAAFRQAWIDGDSLFIDQGDYANELNRMKIHREPWEKGE